MPFSQIWSLVHGELVLIIKVKSCLVRSVDIQPVERSVSFKPEPCSACHNNTRFSFSLDMLQDRPSSNWELQCNISHCINQRNQVGDFPKVRLCSWQDSCVSHVVTACGCGLSRFFHYYYYYYCWIFYPSVFLIRGLCMHMWRSSTVVPIAMLKCVCVCTDITFAWSIINRYD